MTRHRFLLVALFGLLLMFAKDATAGMTLTGSGVRTKTVGPFTAKVYSIAHYMAEKPATKSKQAVIDAAVDKQFVWTMQRDVDGSKIQKALREAFAMNGFNDGGRIGQFVGVFSMDEIKEKANVTIYYSAASKTVTISAGGGGKASIAGEDFMKAVWSIWFGKIDQPSLGDQLIANL